MADIVHRYEQGTKNESQEWFWGLFGANKQFNIWEGYEKY